MSAHRLSLRRRLATVCLTLMGAALTVTGLDSYWREQATLDENMRARLATLAQMVAVNSSAGIEFDAAVDVTNFLQSVTATMQLQAAAVYTATGARFAVAGDPTMVPTTSTLPDATGADWSARATLAYKDDRGEPRVGQVIVRASGAPIADRLHGYLCGLAATGALALLVLGLAAHWLLQRLLRPVADLVETTHEVRRTENWALRAATAADDEIGALVHAFNSLLGAIQERERMLSDNAQRLEQLVQERTAALTRALAAAEAATRAKSTFVANMSHEIRTPLNAVLGMAELAMETQDPQELREYLTVIRSAGSNLLGILCDILDLSKIESEKLDLSPVPTDIETLVLDALRPLTSRIQSKDIELSVDIAPELAPAYLVDDVRLRQILTNLAGNAIKFTARGFVRVHLSLQTTLGEVHELEIAVADSGIGIPPDRLQAVFSPFTQADSTITRRFAGTGLGLSITSRLVQLMGGTIRVESELGVGSTFRVLLPLATCTPPLPPLPKLPPEVRLLVLASSAPLCRALATVGRRLQREVVLLESAEQLAARGPLQPHDVVLLDDRDPDHDAAVCRAVATRADGTRPVVVATSYQDLASAAYRCRSSAFAGYLAKPVSARELAVRLQGLLLPSTAPTKVAPASTSTAPQRSLRILVAEDNAVNQKLIERLLQRDGHTVTIAGDGKRCCEAWAPDRFDLVLMDMQMPEMSGLEAAAHIRRAEANSSQRMPIVALTANTSLEDRQACLHAGMDDVLPKPVSVPRLRATLARFGATPGSPLPPTTKERP